MKRFFSCGTALFVVGGISIAGLFFLFSISAETGLVVTDKVYSRGVLEERGYVEYRQESRHPFSPRPRDYSRIPSLRTTDCEPGFFEAGDVNWREFEMSEEIECFESVGGSVCCSIRGLRVR